MADRIGGVSAPPTESEIAHEDWCGRDLSGESHERVAFVGMDLSETTSRGAVFAECSFRDCRFNASTHVNAGFLNCTFARCSFFDVTFHDCKLMGTMFDRCTFGLLEVSGGDWSFVGLPGADLREASFCDIRMREADLTGTRCQGATLRDVDLSGSWLHGADLSGADLRGSDLPELDPTVVEFRRARINVDQAITFAVGLGLDVEPDEPPSIEGDQP